MGVGETAKAIDAACEAIISWGPRQEQREQALGALQQVVRDAADLPQYLKQLDQRSRESGQDNPLVRKAIGLTYAERNQWDLAAAQLEVSLTLQPHDAAARRKLIECYDKLERTQQAVKQALALLELNPRDLESYKMLAQHYQQLGLDDEVERTYTSIVEALPNESEGHSMLAEIREQQELWDEAARHWRRVAVLRELEPTGLLKLAAVQIRLKQWQAAMETLAKLRARSWPERFSGVDNQIRNLENQLERKTP